MATLHDADTRGQLEQRIRSLSSTSRGRWGKMTVDQMLWHVNKALALSLGQVTLGPGGPKMPKRLLKFMVLKLPWMKSAPTHPDFVAKANYDFEGERTRLLHLIEAVVHKPIDSDWPEHPAFGSMTGREASGLMAKHLDHHLKQFGV
jgi:hypothetical protein